MNRRTERLIIDGFWVLALIFMFVGTYFFFWSGQGVWLCGGGLVILIYLLFTDKYSVKDLIARDDLGRSVGELEQVIDDIQKEGKT